MCDLPNNEEALHTAQMQLMPSRQALNELMLWMDGVEATVNEDEGKTVASLMDVQLLLQKYRVGTDNFLVVKKECSYLVFYQVNFIFCFRV